MIVLGVYQVQSQGNHSNGLWANPLIDVGLGVIGVCIVFALVLSILPTFVRPKLKLRSLSTTYYSHDDQLEVAAQTHGGLKSAICLQVQVSESRGIRGRDVEVWVVSVSPTPPTVRVPAQIEAFGIPTSVYGDVPGRGSLGFKLWIIATYFDGNQQTVSRIGWSTWSPVEIKLEIRHESRVLDSRTYRIPDEIDDSIGVIPK